MKNWNNVIAYARRTQLDRCQYMRLIQIDDNDKREYFPLERGTSTRQRGDFRFGNMLLSLT
jgi:hypothetical protein